MDKNNTQKLIEFAYWQDPQGNEYPLFGGKRALMSWQGFGMPDIDYLSDKGPNQHGRTVRDYRAQERTITLKQYERGCKRLDWWQNIGDLIDAIRPNRSSTAVSGKLLIIDPNNDEFEINARILTGPDGNWDGAGSLVPTDADESLKFLCPDPFWRNPTSDVVVFTITVTTSCLDRCLPGCIGGSGIINNSTDITYTGTWDGDQITINLFGPMVSPVIQNVTTGKTIKVGYTIAPLEVVSISITPDQTTVANNNGKNLIGTIQDVSDLVTFFLATKSDLTTTGVNTIRVTTSGATTASAISIEYFTRFWAPFKPR